MTVEPVPVGCTPWIGSPIEVITRPVEMKSKGEETIVVSTQPGSPAVSTLMGSMVKFALAYQVGVG